MKTTIDLPDDLVRRLKLRALREKKKLKDVAAELLRKGLANGAGSKGSARATIVKDKKTGLPVIQCPITPAQSQQPTPDEIAEILAEQESGWYR